MSDTSHPPSGHISLPTAFQTYFLFRSSANPGPQCDLANGWRQFGSSCYKLHALDWKSWTEARHDCVQDGADLVSITSADEEQFVTGSLDSSHFDLWIGFSTLVRGTWRHAEQLALSFNAGCVKFSVQQCEDELCFSRNATRFPVRSRREMNSSPGPTPRRGVTQTGVPMNLQGTMSYCIYPPFKPEYLSVQSKLKHVF